VTVYMYMCPLGHHFAETTREVPSCPCGQPARRDYVGEGVGIGQGVRVSRDGTMLDQAKVFLPSPKEFSGEGDPDGQKGLRKFYDEHRPKDNKGKHVRPGLEVKGR